MRSLPLLVLLLAHPVFADEPKAPPAPPTEVTHGEGDYGGVQPGQPKKAEPGKQKPKKPPPKGTLAWIGFEAKGGGSEVFFQSVAPFEVNQHVENGVLVVNLGGLTRLGQNTWRPIDTRFFDTSVARITAKAGGKKGKGVEVRIAFKNAKDAAQASVRTATEPDGMYYAYLSFAGGAPATVNEPEKK